MIFIKTFNKIIAKQDIRRQMEDAICEDYACRGHTEFEELAYKFWKRQAREDACLFNRFILWYSRRYDRDSWEI